ncbi:hypothetical protein PAPHI01_0608 [Pancytospora philotis]|nr:hypothetical protein PAPHI01_0608 [Pancytospora philotis]
MRISGLLIYSAGVLGGKIFTPWTMPDRQVVATENGFRGVNRALQRKSLADVEFNIPDQSVHFRTGKQLLCDSSSNPGQVGPCTHESSGESIFTLQDIDKKVRVMHGGMCLTLLDNELKEEVRLGFTPCMSHSPMQMFRVIEREDFERGGARPMVIQPPMIPQPPIFRSPYHF